MSHEGARVRSGKRGVRVQKLVLFVMSLLVAAACAAAPGELMRRVDAFGDEADEVVRYGQVVWLENGWIVTPAYEGFWAWRGDELDSLSDPLFVSLARELPHSELLALMDLYEERWQSTYALPGAEDEPYDPPDEEVFTPFVVESITKRNQLVVLYEHVFVTIAFESKGDDLEVLRDRTWTHREYRRQSPYLNALGKQAAEEDSQSSGLDYYWLADYSWQPLGFLYRNSFQDESLVLPDSAMQDVHVANDIIVEDTHGYLHSAGAQTADPIPSRGRIMLKRTENNLTEAVLLFDLTQPWVFGLETIVPRWIRSTLSSFSSDGAVKLGVVEQELQYLFPEPVQTGIAVGRSAYLTPFAANPDRVWELMHEGQRIDFGGPAMLDNGYPHFLAVSPDQTRVVFFQQPSRHSGLTLVLYEINPAAAARVIREDR